jgi:hypothetical protein
MPVIKLLIKIPELNILNPLGPIQLAVLPFSIQNAAKSVDNYPNKLILRYTDKKITFCKDKNFSKLIKK